MVKSNSMHAMEEGDHASSFLNVHLLKGLKNISVHICMKGKLLIRTVIKSFMNKLQIYMQNIYVSLMVTNGTFTENY